MVLARGTQLRQRRACEAVAICYGHVQGATQWIQGTGGHEWIFQVQHPQGIHEWTATSGTYVLQPAGLA